MKNRKIIALLLLLPILGACKSATVTTKKTEAAVQVADMVEAKEKNCIYSYKTEKKESDIGPGYYIYPGDASFVAGTFRLKSFKIEEDKDNYYFNVMMATDFDNDWDMPQGFCKQLFDIYLNLGKGEYQHTLAGRRVKISQGWDKVIAIAPVRTVRLKSEIANKNVDIEDDVSGPEDILKAVIIPNKIVVKGQILTAIVPKSELDLSKLDGLQLFVLGMDPYVKNAKSMLVREVMPYSSQWFFGGGSFGEAHPNVIDVLGDSSKLGNYLSDGISREFTTIDLMPTKKAE